MLLQLLLAAALASPCQNRVSAHEVSNDVELALTSWSKGKSIEAESYLRQAKDALPCVGQPLDRDLVARYHLASGLVRDPSGSERDTPEFLAARRAGLRPSDLPAALEEDARIEHILSEDERRKGVAEPSKREGVALPPPLRGRLHVDGLADSEAPRDQPYVLQVVVAGRDVRSTIVQETGRHEVSYRRLRPSLIGLAGASSAASVALWASAAATHRRLYEDDWQHPRGATEIERLQTWNHGLWIGGATTAGLTVAALGTLALSYTGTFP